MSPPSLADRRGRLQAAQDTLRRDPHAAPLAEKLNTWKRVGAILDAMIAQGFDVELQQYPQGWWAKFYLAGASHPVCSGSGWAATPWSAVQAAAWETLTVGNAEARLREQLATACSEQRVDPRGGPAGVLRATRST